MIDTVLILEVGVAIIGIYLCIRFIESISKTEKKYVAEKITEETETGELLFSFWDEKYAKKLRRAKLLLHLFFFVSPFAYFVEAGTISRDEVYEMFILVIMVNLVLFVGLKLVSQVRLIEVFSAGIKITQGPPRFFSTEFKENLLNRFYHFSKNDFSEQGESRVLKLFCFEDEIIIDSPEAIETIIEAYENFKAEERE